MTPITTIVHAPEVRTATTMRWAAVFTDGDGATLYEQTEYADGSHGGLRVETTLTPEGTNAWLTWVTA